MTTTKSSKKEELTLQSFDISPGVSLHCMDTDKFKTSTLSIYIERPMSRAEVTKNALIPNVLKRGSAALCESEIKIDTSQKISQYLEELYGAGFVCGVRKKGDVQAIFFSFDFVNDIYINESLFEKILQLARNIVFEPITQDEAFLEHYVSQEKNNLKNAISSLINDKRAYSAERCLQEMCKDENFGIFELGFVEDIPDINAKNLYAHYKSIINSSPIDIFVSGNLSNEKLNTQRLCDIVGKMFNLSLSNPQRCMSGVVKKTRDVKNITEKLEIMQSKLCLGLRTNIAPTDPKYYALIVLNGILGGGAHSKLFNNVREKLSLAYYAYSRLERFKGIMLIGCGIEHCNYKAALDEIMLQIEQIKSGQISEYEYQSTINSFINMVRSTSDSAFAMEDYYFGQILTQKNDSFNDLIEKVSKVSVEEVVEVAGNIVLDTIYFLTGKDDD